MNYPLSMTLRADSARVRARMLTAARRRVAAGDLDLPLNAVAKDAGVGVGTAYRHFPDRQVLLETLAAESYRRLIDAASVAAEDPDPARGLRTLLRAGLQGQLDDPTLSAVLAAPAYRCDETLTLGRELIGRAQQVLERARAAGLIRDDITPDDLRRLLCGIRYAVGCGGEGDTAERYLDVLLRGLRP